MAKNTIETASGDRILTAERRRELLDGRVNDVQGPVAAAKKTINRMQDVGEIATPLKALREFDGITEPSYGQKVAFIRKVLQRFGFSGEQEEIILCQFHRESYNYRAKPPRELDPKVVAGGDSAGIAQIRPMTARAMAQKLGIPELRGIKTVSRTVKGKNGKMRTVTSDRGVINYLREHWATTVILGVAYMAEQRDDIRKMSNVWLSPHEEISRMLASYNGGPGRFRSAFKKEPHSWLKLMPRITQAYVNELLDPHYRQQRIAQAQARTASA